MTATPAPDDFGIAAELSDGRAVVRVRGDVDLLSAPRLDAVLVAVVDGGSTSVVVDLAEVRFLDACGLGVLARAGRGLRSSGRHLTLRAPDGFRRRLLAITGLDRLVRVEPGTEPGPLPATLAAATSLPADRAVLDEALRLVVTLTQATVASADGVSISLDRHGRLRTVAATDDVVSGMDEDQYTVGEGPCVDAAERGRGVHVPALADERRWPDFVPRARGRGIQSILSNPLRVPDGPAGALNIYSSIAHAFTESEQEVASLFAARASQLLVDAGIWMADEQVAARLRDALRVRETIAVARGIVMGRDRVSADEAYTALLRHSRGTGRTLREVAAEVVSSVPSAPATGATAAPAEGRVDDPAAR